MNQKLFFLVLLFINTSLMSQMTFPEIKNIQDNLKTVQTGKTTLKQSLVPIEDQQVIYTLTQVDTKGKEQELIYTFSFSDIDNNTVRSITKGDVILLQLLVTGKQKLIQEKTNGGDKIKYVDELVFYAENSDNVNDLKKHMKELIPKVIIEDEKRLALKSYDDHLKWLLKNTHDVELPKKQIVQKIEAVVDIAGKLILNQTFNAKSKTINETRELNLSTLNPNSVGYKISGDEFIIEASSRRNINAIKYFEDGTQKNYTDAIKIYAKSITNGKDIFKVLKAIIPLAENKFEQSKPILSSIDSASKYLNSVIAEVNTNEETLTQNFSFTDNLTEFKNTEAKPDQSTEYIYNFNFADINANNIDYNGQKDRLFVELPTKKSIKFIKSTKNAEVQNYTSGFTIYFNSIEDAIIGTSALKNLVKNFEKKIEESKYTYSSVTSAVKDIQSLIKKVKVDEDVYDLFIELTDQKTNTLKVTTIFSDLKKSKETVQEFNINNINEKNIVINVSGKRVQVELNTNHLEKIIKTYEDGEIKPYQYKVTIEASNIENARKIMEIIKTIIVNLK